MNADVVAINIVGRMLFDGGIELESDALLQFAEKTIGGPAMAQEEKFQARALAVLAQELRNRGTVRQCLLITGRT